MGFGTSALNAIERAGNRLPDPTTLFLLCIAALVGVSVWGASAGWSALNPATGKVIEAVSLLSDANLKRLLEEMPRTLTSFAPLGTVLVMMLGTGVAEKSGYFAAALSGSLPRAPRRILAPAVVFAGCLSSLAVDAGYVVLVPLGAVVFAVCGRHPLAGLAAAFAGVSGGYSANLFPSALDGLLLGITQEAARLVDPTWSYAITDNYYLIVAYTLLVTLVGWAVTERVVEPRLGTWTRTANTVTVTGEEAANATRRGLFLGTGVLVAMLAGLLLLALPGGPLRGTGATLIEQLSPLFNALVAGLAVAFFLAGLAFGRCTGRYRSDKDVVRDVNDTMSELGGYIVLAFVAAHFIAMFNWSGLGGILAIHGAEGIKGLGLPGPLLFGLLVVFTAAVNLLVGSASAKWGLMAPIVVPLFMLIGYSPEVVTGAYRLGDSATNIITPLMPYFPMVLVFARRYQPDAGIGTLLALMLPYSLGLLVASLGMLGVWIAAGWPVGIDAGIGYRLPGQ